MPRITRDWAYLDSLFQDPSEESQNLLIEEFFDSAVQIGLSLYPQLRRRVSNAAAFDRDEAVSLALTCLVIEIKKKTGMSSVEFHMRLKSMIRCYMLSFCADNCNDFPSRGYTHTKQYVEKVNEAHFKRKGVKVSSDQLLSICEKERKLRKSHRRKLRKKIRSPIPVVDNSLLSIIQLPRFSAFQGLPIKHSGFDEVDTQEIIDIIKGKLTKRECMVLDMRLKYSSNKMIADALGLTQSPANTVIAFVKKTAERVLRSQHLIPA
tara:strand:+ start:25625 stop:26416 length:792 start_codon:yes stop_codon:yes gene_type:complete